ncbi:hypothetical protein ACQJBY_030492 [Aegilops geniculata]
MERRRWLDLPPDLASEISRRLHDVTNFVHFHAVCKSWRASWYPTATTTVQFLPWLLAAVKEDSTRLELRCVLSGSNYRSQPLLSEPWGMWGISTGGTALCYLTIDSLRPSLHDPLTRATAHLPPLPRELGLWGKTINPYVIINDDGTTLLYSISYISNMVGIRPTASFRVALLRPGDAEWTIVERTLECPTWSSEHDLTCVAYQGGKILVIMEAGTCHVVTPNTDVTSDVLVRDERVLLLEAFFGDSTYAYNYVFKSRGEILWVSIQTGEYYRYQPGPDLLDVTVSVQALHEPALSTLQAPDKMTWLRRDGHSLADRVLFLGARHSSVVEAARVPNGQGGCAYFVYQNNRTFTFGKHGVFRCNLIDGKAELVQRLPRCWDDKICTWFNPASVINPPQEISEWSLEQQPKIAPTISGRPTHTLHIERNRVPSLRLLVRGLPLTVKSTQLRLFFSQHGKVSSAEVICYKKTGASLGIGNVAIQMTHAHEEDALAALSELVLDGHRLEVSLLKEGQPRRRRHWRKRRYI